MSASVKVAFVDGRYLVVGPSRAAARLKTIYDEKSWRKFLSLASVLVIVIAIPVVGIMTHNLVIALQHACK